MNFWRLEASNFILVADIEKLLQLSIWKDASTIVRCLEVVFLDIRSDHLSDISGCHLGAVIYTEELSKLLGNGSRLYKSTWCTGPLFLFLFALTLSMDFASRITCFSRVLKSALSLLRLMVRA